MADIFISYAREDRQAATRLAALAASGRTVFWDREIPPGKTWAQVIEEQMDQCRAIVVLWSAASIDSDWVNAEAHEGWDRKILLPALLEPVRPRLPFRTVQAADLIGWQGGPDHPGFRLLDSAVAALIEQQRHGRPPPMEAAQANETGPDIIAATAAERRIADPAAPRGAIQPEPQPSVVEPPPRTVTRRERESPDRRGWKWSAGAALVVLIAIGSGALLLPEFDREKPSAGKEASDEVETGDSRNTSPSAEEEAPTVQPAAGGSAEERRPGDTFRDCRDGNDKCGLEMVVVPAGAFLMGSPGEGDGFEHPQHRVVIPEPFAMGKHEVTFAQWDACVAGGGCAGYRPDDRAGVVGGGR